MPNVLTPTTNDFLAEAAPSALERLDLGIARLPLLQQRQSDQFNADQSALEAVKDASAALAEVYREAADNGVKADARVVERLERTAAARKEARSFSNASLKASTRVSAGTGEAIDRTISFAQRLTSENAEIELADVDLEGRDPEQVVEVEREFQQRLDEQLADVETALQPKEEVLAMALAGLGALRDRGRVRVGASGTLRFATTPLPVVPLAGSEVISIFDAEAAHAAANYDQLAQQIEAEVGARYSGVDSTDILSNAQRRQRKLEIAEQRLQSELAECAAIFAMWTTGRLDVGLRADVAPQAVLGIASWHGRGRRTDQRLPVLEG